MSSVTHEQVRLEMLEVLYKMAHVETTDWGVDRDTMQRALRISERDMDATMLYLSQRNLVRLIPAQGVLWLWAKITQFGIEVFENKGLYERQFPFLRAGKSR